MASESTLNCKWDLYVKAHSKMQTEQPELENAWLQPQLTEALTLLCTKWLFSRQLSEVAHSLYVVWKPKRIRCSIIKVQQAFHVSAWAYSYPLRVMPLITLFNRWHLNKGIRDQVCNISELRCSREGCGWSLASNMTDTIHHKFTRSLTS